MPTTEDFRQALRDILSSASREGRGCVEVRSGDVHTRLGGYPGPSHRMPTCCDAMRSMMLPGDVVLRQPPKGSGASLVIRYALPRP